MLTSITIQADPAIDIPIIGATIANPYIIQGITGLGPPDISVSLGELSTDGSVYQNRRTPSRNPVFLVGLNPNYKINQTIDDLRDRINTAFLEPDNETDEVMVTLHDSLKQDRYLYGHVDKIEISQFVKNPQVQISMLCPNPYLLGAEIVSVPNGDSVTVSNLGSSKCGFYMDISFTADSSGLTITRDLKTIFETDYEFLNGDELEFSTIFGERIIRRKRAGVWLNIIDTTVNLKKWPMLKPGNDTITLSTSSVVWNSFKYTPRWWGV